MANETEFIQEFLSMLAPRAKVDRGWQRRPIPVKRNLKKISRTDATNVSPSDGQAVDEKPLEICVKLLKPPAAHRMLVKPSDTIGGIKDRLVERGVVANAGSIRLILKGKALVVTKRVSDYNLVSGATIHATLSKAAAAVTPTSGSGNTGNSEKKSNIQQHPLDESIFWTNLETFLKQQLSDPAIAQQTLTLFREAWKTSERST